MAARVSILATTSGPRGWGSVPTRRTSWAERTKETATMSTPASTKASRMRRSSGVGVLMRRRSEGMCTPGRPHTWPPWVISAVQAGPVLVDDLAVDGAVAEAEPVADLDVGEQVLVADLDHLGGATARRRAPAARRRPSARSTPSLPKEAGPHLGAGQVDQGADVAAGLGRPACGPVRGAPRRVLERAVGEVEPDGVHARADQAAQHGLGLRRRPDRGQDLGTPQHRATLPTGRAGREPQYSRRSGGSAVSPPGAVSCGGRRSRAGPCRPGCRRAGPACARPGCCA